MLVSQPSSKKMSGHGKVRHHTNTPRIITKLICNVQGEIATSGVTEFDNLDGKGYGTKIMGAAMFVRCSSSSLLFY